MKNIKRILLFSFMLTFIFSCSIEKRIYSSGYHVQWTLKKQSVDKNSTAIAEEKTLRVQSKSEIKKDVQLTSLQEQSNEIEELIVAESIESSTNIKKIITKDNFPLAPILHNNIQDSEMDTVQPKTDFNKVNVPENGGRMSGVYMLLLALLFLLLAFVFYTYLGVFGMIFAIIFWIAAGLLLIYGIIKIIFA